MQYPRFSAEGKVTRPESEKLGQRSNFHWNPWFFRANPQGIFFLVKTHLEDAACQSHPGRIQIHRLQKMTKMILTRHVIKHLIIENIKEAFGSVQLWGLSSINDSSERFMLFSTQRRFFSGPSSDPSALSPVLGSPRLTPRGLNRALWSRTSSSWQLI